MPITWNDFDKIWAVSSPLTPYTFSDLNYAAGWNFIGSTPPARQMWDSLQKANDEKFKFLRDNFGTPNMVTTAAQMTDTDKIYVYVGSEAGWNNGHWYYYDAGTSTWVDGGVYNSTAFVTDTTLTEAGKAADAKAVGDALALKADLAGATFTGNVAVNADFSTTGDATVASDLTVSGATNLTGNVTASGNVSVVGDIDADNITLTGDISATDVTASGDVTAGALSVSGATTLTGNVTAGADITATGDVTANDASFVNATLSGTLSVTGATTLDGLTAGSVSAQSLNTTGNVTVGGTLTVSGATTLADITTGDINANDITATGDISADDITANTLTVSGATTLTGNVTAGADITVTGDLSVNDITASGDITSDNVTANGNLSVVGNATLSGVSTAVTPAEDDNSTKIATTAYVQTEIKPIETDVSVNDKRLANIEKLLQGNLYDYQTDTDSAYTKSVPQGAMPYASLEQIGGKTLVWNQLVNTLATDTYTTNGITFTVNADKSITISGTATDMATYMPSTSVYAFFPLVVGHKYYHYAPTGIVWGDRNGRIGGSTEIKTVNAGGTNNLVFFRVLSGDTVNVTFYPMIHDLTLCYGAGNEPTTIEQFREMFPSDYYEYNAGTLLSAGVTEVVSKGKNMLPLEVPSDALHAKISGGTIQTATNPRTFGVQVKMNTNYQITYTVPFSMVVALGSKSPAIGDSVVAVGNTDSVSLHIDINTGNNSYILFYTPSESDYQSHAYASQLMLREVGTDMSYTPYKTPIQYPIPAEIQALEGYGWSAGTVYNYIDYERKVFVQNVGAVDISTLSYIRRVSSVSGLTYFDSTSLQGTKKYDTKNLFSSNFIITPNGTSAPVGSPYGLMYGAGNYITFYADYPDVASFKTAMDGVMLYYELATPVEVDISAYLTDDNLIEVESGGSLTFPNSNGDDYRIDVPSSETYMIDLQSALGE